MVRVLQKSFGKASPHIVSVITFHMHYITKSPLLPVPHELERSAIIHLKESGTGKDIPRLGRLYNFKSFLQVKTEWFFYIDRAALPDNLQGNPLLQGGRNSNMHNVRLCLIQHFTIVRIPVGHRKALSQIVCKDRDNVAYRDNLRLLYQCKLAEMGRRYLTAADNRNLHTEHPFAAKLLPIPLKNPIMPVI